MRDNVGMSILVFCGGAMTALAMALVSQVAALIALAIAGALAILLAQSGRDTRNGDH